MPCSDRNQHIYKNQEPTFEVIGFLVTEKIAHHYDREHQQCNLKDLEVQVNGLEVAAP